MRNSLTEADTQDRHERFRGVAVSALRVAAWRRAGRALRAADWWYFAAVPLVALVGDGRGEDEVVAHALGGVLVAALCLAYAYGINGITDRGMDRDETKNSLVGLAAVPPEAVVLVAACAFGAVSIAMALSLAALLGASVSLVAATFYSAHLRLKRLPVVGTLVNVLIFAPLPLLGVVHRPSLRMQFLAYCFLVLVSQNQILHEVADAREDASGGVRTTGVVVGIVGLRVIAFALGPLSVLPLFWMQATSTALFASVLALCAGAAMIAVCNPQRAGQLRVAHRWFSLGVGAVLFALAARGGA